MQLALVAGDFGNGQTHRRSGHVSDHVHLVGVEPLASHVGPHIGFVLVVSAHHFNFELGAGGFDVVFDGHAGSQQRARASDVRVQARHVVHHADFDDAVRNLGLRRTAKYTGRSSGNREKFAFHGFVSWLKIRRRGTR